MPWRLCLSNETIACRLLWVLALASVIPAFIGSFQTDRWGLWFIAIASLFVVLPRHHQAGFAGSEVGKGVATVGILALIVGHITIIDKFVLFGGLSLLFACLVTQKEKVTPAYLLCITVILGLLIPLPSALAVWVETNVQQLELGFALGVLNSLSIPAYAQGFDIVIGNEIIRLSEDCSVTGLTIPCLMGAASAAALRRKSLAETVIWMAASAIAGFILNAARILALVLIAPLTSLSLYTLAHDAFGLLLMGIIWSLPFWITGTRLTIPPQQFSALKPMRFEGATMAAALTLAFVPTLLNGALGPAPHLPSYYQGWVSEAVAIPEMEERILRADWLERRRYLGSDGTAIIATLIHYEDAALGRRHSSRDCFKRLGWTLSEEGKQTQFPQQFPLQIPQGQSLFKATAGSKSQWVTETVYRTRTGSLTRLQLVAHDVQNIAPFGTPFMDAVFEKQVTGDRS